jgi:hypothetical protein
VGLCALLVSGVLFDKKTNDIDLVAVSAQATATMIGAYLTCRGLDSVPRNVAINQDRDD